jgi:TPR repeat protein
MNKLGELYCYGRGVAQDYGSAHDWYQKAAEADDAEAKQALSRLPSR